MPEWQTLLRLAGIAAGQGPDADIDAFDDFVIGSLVARELQDPASPLAGRDADELIAAARAAARARSGCSTGCCAPARTATASARDPDGLTLAQLEAAPHGIDLGPLEPRIPEVLRTASGKIELAPEPIVADVERLRAALARHRNGGIVLIGRRQLRSNNSWMHNVPNLVRGKERCTMHVHPDDAERLGLEDGGLAQRHLRARRDRGHGRGDRRDHARRGQHPARLGPRRPRGAGWTSRQRTPARTATCSPTRWPSTSPLGQRGAERHPGRARACARRRARACLSSYAVIRSPHRLPASLALRASGLYERAGAERDHSLLAESLSLYHPEVHMTSCLNTVTVRTHGRDEMRRAVVEAMSDNRRYRHLNTEVVVDEGDRAVLRTTLVVLQGDRPLVAVPVEWKIRLRDGLISESHGSALPAVKHPIWAPLGSTLSLGGEVLGGWGDGLLLARLRDGRPLELPAPEELDDEWEVGDELMVFFENEAVVGWYLPDRQRGLDMRDRGAAA